MKVLFIVFATVFAMLLGLSLYSLCKIAGECDYEIGEEWEWKD